MPIPVLTLVDSQLQIQVSLDTFNSDYQEDPDLARELLRQTTLWVYSRNSKAFGPSKFVGFQNMNFRDYAAARRGHSKRFDGGRTHKAIEKALGTPYAENPQLSLELEDWGKLLVGPDVFERVDKTKWKFISL